MSEHDPLAEMEIRILDAITASEERLRADFLAALGQRTAQIMARLSAVQRDAATAMATGLDVNRKLREGRNDLSGLEERLDAESRRITALGERLDTLENGRRAEEG